MKKYMTAVNNIRQGLHEMQALSGVSLYRGRDNGKGFQIRFMQEA